MPPGSGYTQATLAACQHSVTIYNSLDVGALRIPPEVSRHIGIVLTALPAQSRAARACHPGAMVKMLPVGPEFASPETFFPIPGPKDFEVIYLAAAQPSRPVCLRPRRGRTGLARPLRRAGSGRHIRRLARGFPMPR